MGIALVGSCSIYGRVRIHKAAIEILQGGAVFPRRVHRDDRRDKRRSSRIKRGLNAVKRAEKRRFRFAISLTLERLQRSCRQSVLSTGLTAKRFRRSYNRFK